MRLKPPAAALKFKRTNYAELREKLVWRMERREQGAYEDGFKAGRAARLGPPPGETTPTYPRAISLG
jgi:hypothetical protein